ncbi:MAG: polysaccharide export protein [Desulfatitalea sp.]|nr:polysaccharide export protein [Desulfatitalea sp.]NNK02491.1 polysaccharide export protein [Desulfatitalea sp.]
MTTDQMPRNVAVETVMPDYRVGIGDVLHISVWKDEALNRDVMVLPDGTISFPLIGRISVNGLTVEALVEVVEDRLDKYVPDPTISVQVLQTISQAVYIIGKVNRPGRFDLPNNLNVLQALALAGGLNPFAKSRHIKIFRETDEGTQIYDFNYEEVSKGEKLTQNIRLQRGDVIVVR